MPADEQGNSTTWKMKRRILGQKDLRLFVGCGLPLKTHRIPYETWRHTEDQSQDGGYNEIRVSRASKYRLMPRKSESYLYGMWCLLTDLAINFPDQQEKVSWAPAWETEKKLRLTNTRWLIWLSSLEHFLTTWSEMKERWSGLSCLLSIPQWQKTCSTVCDSLSCSWLSNFRQVMLNSQLRSISKRALAKSPSLPGSQRATSLMLMTQQKQCMTLL